MLDDAANAVAYVPVQRLRVLDTSGDRGMLGLSRHVSVQEVP